MKRAIKIFILLVIVLILVAAITVIFAGSIVKSAINTAGPRIMGVPVSVKSVDFELMKGKFFMGDLVVGNPEGFKTPEAIRVKSVGVDVKLSSIFSKVVVIEWVHVDSPEITYELGLKGSNIGAIQDRIGSASEDSGKKPAKKTEKDQKEGKKVEITDLLVQNGMIHLSAVGLGGRAATVPLAEIHITDLGKDKGGASVQEIVMEVFSVIVETVSNATRSLGDGAMDKGKAIGDEASKVFENAKDIFRTK